MRTLIFSFILIFSAQVCSQEIGDVREVELILVDIPFSGDAKQPNFITPDSTEIISFNDMDWLDKHIDLYYFFHKYKDICKDSSYHFMVTMIYIPTENYIHKRYEGYIPTGEKVNSWVLTSIVEIRKNHSKKQ